eukprot:4360796-Alexandrium_andersonii.AAC.1
MFREGQREELRCNVLHTPWMRQRDPQQVANLGQEVRPVAGVPLGWEGVAGPALTRAWRKPASQLERRRGRRPTSAPAT